MTPKTTSNVRIPTPQRYAIRLAKHFEHRVSVHREDELVRIHFADATCELRWADEQLSIELKAVSLPALGRSRDVVARHLKQVASQETFDIDWNDVDNDAAPRISVSVAPSVAGEAG